MDGAAAADRAQVNAAIEARVEHVLVVVPARDEQALIGACLDSLGDAVALLAGAPRPRRCTVVVVLDRCTDSTADVVAARPWVHAVTVDLGVVGAVRSRGVEVGLELLAGAGAAERPVASPCAVTGRPAALRRERVWLAHTDADSRVPPHWLTRQLAMADTGVDLVLGTVEPDPADLSPHLHARWGAAHRLSEGHAAVHGANLGVRLSAYEQVGGFASLAVHEDVDLARRVAGVGGRCRSTDLTRVLTSGRASSRVLGGFADYLLALDGAELEPGA